MIRNGAHLSNDKGPSIRYNNFLFFSECRKEEGRREGKYAKHTSTRHKYNVKKGAAIYVKMRYNNGSTSVLKKREKCRKPRG